MTYCTNKQLHIRYISDILEKENNFCLPFRPSKIKYETKNKIKKSGSDFLNDRIYAMSFYNTSDDLALRSLVL